MKANFKYFSQYKFAVEMHYDVIVPSDIRKWLLIKDSPFDASHILYINKAIKRHVVAFEFYDDAIYFIAWMECEGIDTLE